MRLLARWRHRTAWMVVIGFALAVVCAAGVDYAWLHHHLVSGPFTVHSQGCAGKSQSQGPTNTAVGASSWTSFQAGPAHNPLLTTARKFAVSWSFSTGGSVVSAPSVVKGVVYAGSMDTCVYALNATTGRMIWAAAMNNQVMSQPLVAAGRVFVASGNKGYVGDVTRGTGQSGLYALNAATGVKEWLFPTVGENMPTPAYSNGVLYEAGGGRTFYAVDASTGKLLWQVNDGAIVSMSSTTLVGNIAVFGGCAPCQLMGVNIQTHKLAWVLPLPQSDSGIDDGTPAALGNTVFIQAPEGSVFKQVVELALNATTGQVLWQTTLGTDLLNPAQRAAGEGALAAFDGEEVGVATVAGNRLYVGSPGIPDLWALDPATGAIIWSTHLSQAVRTPPLLVGGNLFMTGNSVLEELAAATGTIEDTRVYNNFVEGTGINIPCTTAAPVVVGGTMFLAGGNNGSTITASPLGAAS